MILTFLLRRLKWVLTLLLLLSLCGWAYARYISETKVALVNYQDFQAARFLQANDSDWISVHRLAKDQLSSLSQYDVVYVFGRGLSLTPLQVKLFKQASSDGVMVVVEASTNPRIDVTNVDASAIESIQDYLRYGGQFNYQQLLRFSRYQLDGKTFGVEPAKAPKANTSDVLFHKDEAKLFTELSEYQTYYQSLPSYVPEGKKIALLTSVPGPFNANRDHLDALIDELEQAGMRVYPIASYTRRLALVKAVEPDAVIMMPHGRMQLGSGQQTIDYLTQANIPLFAPVSVFEHYEKWLKNRQGYSDNMLTMNVVLPELDGAIVPYAINAQFLDDNQYQIFKAMPQRLSTFRQMITRWLSLKVASNKDKKLAFVYFRGPGKNALVAGNMEVTPSLFNTLHELKHRGYELGELPNEYAQFRADIERQGAVMAPYAQGLIEQFFDNATPALVDAKRYQQWCYNLLAKGLCEEVDAMYGKAPGRFMLTEVEGKTHIGVARLQYGNIALLPQPLPGLGKDTFKLVHGTKKAPPHSYIAPYLWIREAFQADAIIHYGTHGSLEFTQGKQVALSQYDWADALIGELPHFYVYTMSNVGEAIIAKRRSYATIISHLTAPFKESGLYSELKSLSDLVGQFDQVQGSVQRQLQQHINQLLVQQALLIDLSLSESQLALPPESWSTEVLLPLTQYLETVAVAKISSGLYTLGKAYTESQAQETARLMAVDSLSSSYQALLSLSGEGEIDEGKSRELAMQWISQIFAQGDSDALLQRLIAPALQQRAVRWFEHNQGVTQADIIKGFIAMGEKSGKAQTITLSTDALMQLTADVISDATSREFIQGLSNEQSFSHVVKALDPSARQTAKVLAKVIPAIGKAVAQLDQPKVHQLVSALQDDAVRKQVLGWANSEDLAELVQAHKSQKLYDLSQQITGKLEQVLAPIDGRSDWLALSQALDSRQQLVQQLKGEPQLLETLGAQLTRLSGVEPAQFTAYLAKQISTQSTALASLKDREQQLALAVRQFEQSLTQVEHYKSHLLLGADNELATLANALNGGYVSPSSGGDPIVNPAALPTGRNLYAIDAEKTPSEAAWQVGKQLADNLLQAQLQETGRYPKKVSFTLWPSEFIHTQGATIAQAFYLLGVEPVRDPFGRVKNLKLIPASELQRPRIDVVVQSAGQLRDLAASRLALIERAVKMVADAPEDGLDNHVASGVAAAQQYMLDKGVAPLDARANAYRRSFGGVNGAYGTAIMSQVEQGERWQDDGDIAKQYLSNMGAVYGDSDSWGEFTPHLFAAALQNTEVVIQPRGSNTWGALSLDHVYEFMGGLNLAVRHVTGSDPQAYFNDFRNPNAAKVTSLNETIWTEMRTTLLNPTYISDLMQGEASSAETFAETFRNTFGWNVMKPAAISESLWDQLHDVYIDDKHNLALTEFFSKQNPYALQELTGVMLEAARKGMWQADEVQLASVANLHAQMVAEFEAGCGDFTCGNASLQRFITQNLSDATLLDAYQMQLQSAQLGSNVGQGVVLKKQNAKAEQQSVESESEQSANEQSQAKQTDDQRPEGKASYTHFLWLLLLPLALLLIRRKRNA